MADAHPTRLCGKCNTPYVATHGSRKYCDDCRSHQYKRNKPTARPCVACGCSFLSRRRDTKYCSKPCGWGTRPKSEWQHGTCTKCSQQFERRHSQETNCVECRAQRNARRGWDKGKVWFDGFWRWGGDLVRRDNCRCYICDRPTPLSKRNRHEPDSPQLDHIVPIAQGGAHHPDNMANLCRECNREKTDGLLWSCDLGRYVQGREDIRHGDNYILRTTVSATDVAWPDGVIAGDTATKFEPIGW